LPINKHKFVQFCFRTSSTDFTQFSRYPHCSKILE